MNVVTVGFTIFLILSLAAAVLLGWQVIRGVRGGHSAVARAGTSFPSRVTEGRRGGAESD